MSMMVMVMLNERSRQSSPTYYNSDNNIVRNHLTQAAKVTGTRHRTRSFISQCNKEEHRMFVSILRCTF
jgi:hypothetical protein